MEGPAIHVVLKCHFSQLRFRWMHGTVIVLLVRSILFLMHGGHGGCMHRRMLLPWTTKDRRGECVLGNQRVCIPYDILMTGTVIDPLNTWRLGGHATKGISSAYGSVKPSFLVSGIFGEHSESSRRRVWARRRHHASINMMMLVFKLMAIGRTGLLGTGTRTRLLGTLLRLGNSVQKVTKSLIIGTRGNRHPIFDTTSCSDSFGSTRASHSTRLLIVFLERLFEERLCRFLLGRQAIIVAHL